MNWLHWAILSAIFAGLTAILAKVGVKEIDSNLATAIRTIFILVFAWIIALAASGTQAVKNLNGKAWIFLALSGAATAASWLCYFRALKLGEASQVAPIDKLSVVVAIVLAVIFLKEQITWRHIVGSILIIAGSVFIATIRPAKAQGFEVNQPASPDRAVSNERP